MRLYLIRHAKAERRASGQPEEARALTARGHRQAEWLAGHLEADGSGPARILSSPAVRAMETAQHIAERLGLEIEVEPSVALGSHAGEVLGFLGKLPGGSCLGLVGHNPTLSQVCELLLTGVGGNGRLELRTGEAALIELSDPGEALAGGTLVELLRIPEAEDVAS